MTAPVAPATSPTSTKTPVAVATTGGFIAGILAIFLPLLQALPHHLSSGTVSSAVVAGAVMVLGSVGTFAAHHGLLTKAEITTGTTLIQQHLPEIQQAIAALPILQHSVSEANRVAADAKVKATQALFLATPAPPAPAPAPSTPPAPPASMAAETPAPEVPPAPA